MNTTFTTYAEKKAKQILNLLQGYTQGIRITAILILLLMGVNNAWADIAFSGGYIYFDNSIGINQTYIQLCARQSSWTGVSTMTNISNTKLYYVANPQGSNWGGILGWVVIGNSTTKTNSNFDNWSTYGWCSNWNTYGFNSGSTYLIVPTSTSKSQSVNTSYLSGGYSALNYTQTIKTAVNGADANSKAAITVTSYNLTGNGAISSQKSASISTSAKSTTISAARTATTTLTVGAVATGYQFDGWYTAATDGTKLSTSTTYTYYPTAATTVYARFSAKKYDITYKDQGGSNFSGSHATGYPTQHTYGTATTLKTATKNGYTFGGWHTNAACTNKVTSLGATAYTANITLYAKWTEIVEEKFTVTISNDGNGTTTPSGEQQVGASGISVTATPKGGYRFKNWTATTGITITNTTSATTTIKASQAGTVTANFEVEPCVYFINTGNWSNVYIHAWKDGGEGTAWPGIKLTTTETIKGFDIYKYTLPAGKDYNKVIFHENTGDEHKTADLEWVNGKYYDFYQGKWFDRNEFEAMVSKIYFKNTLGWKNVYLYTFSTDVWVADKGVKPKNSRHDYGKMTQIENTDIFYYEISNCNFAHIAFSDADMSGYNEFYQNNAVYRSDHDYKMALFIPQKDQTPSTTNDTKYYSSGLWMKYNSTESGYNLVGGFNGWNDNADKFTAGSTGVYQFEVEMNLGASSTYEFKIKKDGINDWFGKNSTTITSTKNSNIIFVSQEGNVKITTTSAGIHIFSIDLSEGKLNLSVEYPLAKGDYRMVYIESETKGTEPYTKFHPAQSIRGITDGEKLDTVSFFINKTNGQNPAILLQRCSEIDGATITWEDIAIQYINGNGGANPVLAQAPAKKSAELHIGNGCPAVTKDAVYNFVLEQTNTGSHKAQILAENTHPYTGNYYIRTDGAAGGWRKYLTNPDNIMTHSQTALTHGGYDYYFCEWMLKDNNVKYVVANDYSYCVSDTLAKDDIVTDENGNLPADANVRYTWNSSTNALKRAYINGSGTIADRYLVLIGNEYLKDADGNAFPEGEGDRTGLHENETTFADMGNWLYQVDIKASKNTLVNLTANYNGKIQYFKGAEDATVPIITGAEEEYKFRLIYDFKTNYLLCGLTENGEISENISVDEAMIMRSHHELAQTFNVTNAGSIKTIKTIYGVMNFNKNTLNGAGSEHERALYWVSFPFDVNLGEAFGFGNYGEHWIMEYYDGKERAEKGLWKEPTYSYWKYITNPNYILEAGKGYVLCLDLDLLGLDADFWDNTNDIALYFPSNDENITIDSNPSSKTTEVDEWECTIERDDRKTKDSNWNIIGVAGYKNFPDINTQGLRFYYEYFANSNTYEVNMAAAFNCMHAYMVQFAGTIEWGANQVTPKAIAARKQSSGKDQYTLRLALQQEDTQCDHTFIRLQEDNATAEFDMNYDLCKIINSGANIYSMIGNVEVAANVLPVEERIIPLGLDIEEDGNYTFAMPDGTDGITATLIDYETGTETNLLLADYTVELNAGIDNERFALRVRPSHVATEVENTILTDSNDNVKKYIIDGALYLLRDGKLYDAQGRMVQQ